MLDCSSLDNIIRDVQPDEIYNLAAQSHVRISFEIPQFTVQTNALGTLNVLEAMRRYAPQARFYQASSSEMFGNIVDPDGKQRETTRMVPVSPYGCAKLFAYSLTAELPGRLQAVLRQRHSLQSRVTPACGNFVTSKIVKNAVLIAKGKLAKLELGNLDAQRDWGHSKDYVRAMHLILQHDQADDFVIAQGKTHSVRQFCEIVFRKLGLDYRDHVVQNPKFMRPEELNYLCGDSTKARQILKWQPVYTLEMLIDEMIETFQESIERNRGVLAPSL